MGAFSLRKQERPRPMRRDTIISIAVTIYSLCWSAPIASAESEQRIYKFKLPEYRDDGSLKTMINGGAATVMPGAVVEITDFRIEFYKDDGETMDMRVEAPHCVYNRRGEIAKSPGTVKIEAENILVTGSDFAWDRKRELLKIFKDSRVVLKNVKEKISKE